jgi:hypothetical protein
MLNRLLSSIAIVSSLGIPSAAQAPAAAASRAWTAPLTPDRHPDLQGNWLSKSATPLERPKQLEGRQFLTDDEVAELKKRAERIFKDGHSDFGGGGDNVFLAALANVEQFKNPNSTGDSTNMVEREFDNRTSLIIDPPDGRIPAYTALGQQRRAEFLAALVTRNAPAGREGLTPDQRCITFGVPRVGSNYSAGNVGYYQIFQTPDHVVFFMEAIHEARVIPLDGRPHLPSSIRTWNGDSRGHWEAKTLVVDTTNFSAKTNFLGAADDLHLVERFTRVAPDEIQYEITVDAPSTWARPWTAMVRLKRTEEMIYEFACHEGNGPIMETMLTGTRASKSVAGKNAKDK